MEAMMRSALRTWRFSRMGRFRLSGFWRRTYDGGDRMLTKQISRAYAVGLSLNSMRSFCGLAALAFATLAQHLPSFVRGRGAEGRITDAFDVCALYPCVRVDPIRGKKTSQSR
jgi:hypothetical protein